MSNSRECLLFVLAHTTVSREPLRYERGVNTFDTANVYSNGLSEVYLGNAIKALKLPREEIVVMTKVCGLVCLPGEAQTMLIASRSFISLSVK